MFVIIIARGLPTNDYPLLGIFEFDQAKALKDLGHKVVYFAIDLRSIRKKRRWGFYNLNSYGIPVYTLSIPLGPIYYKLFLRIGGFLSLWCLKKIIKKEGRPDILHSHFTAYSAIASLIKKRIKVPLIVTEHSSLINRKELDTRNRYFSTRAYESADHIISVSKALSNKIYQHFGFKTTVIPNILDVTNFSYSGKKVISDKFSFVSVGSLVPGKGFELLINAFSKIENKKVSLKIIGEGPLKSKLLSLIRDRSCEDNIKLLGRLTRKEINDVFTHSNVFVLASKSETFGVSYIEAMLAGLPVIATKCGGPEDFVNETNGILVDVDDEIGLRNALIYMMNNFMLYNPEDISSFSKVNFSSSHIARRLTKIYNNIIENQ